MGWCHVNRKHITSRRYYLSLDETILHITLFLSFRQDWRVIMTSIQVLRAVVDERPFSDLSGLRQHSSTHSGEKPHRCSVCGKGFLRRAAVRLHMRSHAGQEKAAAR